MRAPIYKPDKAVLAVFAEAMRYIEKMDHRYDCCAEYDDDKQAWVTLSDDHCWCGRTALLEKMRKIVNAR